MFPPTFLHEAEQCAGEFKRERVVPSPNSSHMTTDNLESEIVCRVPWEGGPLDHQNVAMDLISVSTIFSEK